MRVHSAVPIVLRFFELLLTGHAKVLATVALLALAEASLKPGF